MTLTLNNLPVIVSDDWDGYVPATLLTGAVLGSWLPMSEQLTPVDATEAREAPVQKRGTLTGTPDGDDVTGADVLALRKSLGRKFDASDMTAPLIRFATSYAPTYRPDGGKVDGYMADMAYAARKPRGLSAGMTKGVLNVYCARNRDVIAPAPVPAAPAPTAAPVAPVAITPGAYWGADGDAYVVQKARESDNLYGKRWNGEKFEYCPGAMRTIRGGRPMTLDEAASFGKLSGSCCCCGRKLTRKDSIAAGIGPVCASRF